MSDSVRHIRRLINRECSISRIPGLFPFIDNSIEGKGSIISAINSDNGCYGHLMPNFYTDEISKLKIVDIDGNIIVDWTEEGIDDEEKKIPRQGIPYRVLMDVYYFLSDKNTEIDDSQSAGVEDFIAFIDKYIGLIRIDVNELLSIDSSFDPSVCDLTPEHVYLANVASLCSEYKRNSKMCKFYEELIEKGEDKDATMCCLCEKYKRMGGDIMLKWLENNIELAKERAEEALTYAKDIPDYNINILITQNCSDMGVVVPAIVQWKEKERYVDGTFVIYDNELYLVNPDKIDENGYVDGSKWDEKNETLIFNSDVFILFKNFVEDGDDKQLKRSHNSNSQLWACRREVKYINILDEQETPEDDEDWLFYYRVNQPVKVEFETDSFGNLLDTEGKPINDKSYIENALIIGNIITDIEASPSEKTITFTYRIGAELTTKDAENSYDDDGKTYVTIPTDAVFEVKKEETRGVECIETYRYNDKRLIELIGEGEEVSEEFKKYINHQDKLNESDEDGIDRMAKYPFIRFSAMFSYDRQFGDLVFKERGVKSTVIDNDNLKRNISDIDHIKGSEIIRDNSDNKEDESSKHFNFIRNGYHLGISYPDELDSSVHIRRGTTSVFERHYKLSEIKTLTDMEEYSNGGFFNMINGQDEETNA